MKKESLDKIAESFLNKFPEKLNGLRTIGREAEYPFITQEGWAGDIRNLWEELTTLDLLIPEYEGEMIVALKNDDYSLSAEVGLGTVELITRPTQNLFELEKIYQKGFKILNKSTKKQGYDLIGFGIQPCSKASLEIMTPKERYLLLYKILKEAWLPFTVTASDQIQISITRSEVIPMMNFGNLIAPVLIALCGNSSVTEGKLSPFVSTREAGKSRCFSKDQRYGMIQKPYQDIFDFVLKLSQKRWLLHKENERFIIMNKEKFDEEKSPLFEAFMIHDHYIWHCARARGHGTIEIRPSCQQPINESMCNSALILGFIEAREDVEHYIQTSLGINYWNVMLKLYEQVSREGLAIKEPVNNFFLSLLNISKKGLQMRNLGEEQFLSPLYTRLENKMNPGQIARSIFQKNGLKKLIEYLKIQ